MALIGIKDSANLTLKSKKTGAPVLFADYANTSTNEWSSDRTYANAKGIRAIAWDSNRQSTLKTEMEVFDLKWLAMLAGTEINSGSKEIAKREVVVAKEGAMVATLAKTPVEGSVSVVPLESDKITHKGDALKLAEGETATTGEFKLAESAVTLADEGIFAVYYLTEVPNAKSFTISADKFPEAFEVTADAMIRNKDTGADEFVQITYPNARPQSNFTVTMSATDATNLEVTFDLFPDADGNMATYVIIED